MHISANGANQQTLSLCIRLIVNFFSFAILTRSLENVALIAPLPVALIET